MENSEKCAVVDRYVEAFATGDLGIIRDIYAAGARVEDPVGTAPHEGIEAVCAFYEGALAAGASHSVVLKTLHDQGFTLTLSSFQSTLARLRRERRAM